MKNRKINKISNQNNFFDIFERKPFDTFSKKKKKNIAGKKIFFLLDFFFLLMSTNQTTLLLSKLTKLVDISSSDEKITEIVQNTLQTISEAYLKTPVGVPEEIKALNELEDPKSSPLLSEFAKQKPIFMHKPQSDDKEKVKAILGDFDPNKSEAWLTLEENFGVNVKQPPLLEIAKIIGQHVHINVNRNARRRKSVLIKWYHDNWDVIKPYIKNFRVDDETVTLIQPLE